MKRSVAPVVCAQAGTPDWTLQSVEGTAFFVFADGTFLTPNHVIEGINNPVRQNPCPSPALYIPVNGWQTTAQTFRVDFYAFVPSLCKIDRSLDTAVCKPIKPITGIVPVILEHLLPPDGTPVAFTGFPLRNVTPITSIGAIAGYTDERGTGPLSIIVDKNNWPVASGSPIYLQNGKVVGMLALRGAGEGAGLTYGRTSKALSDVLGERSTE